MFAINHYSPSELQVSRVDVEREASKARLPRFVSYPVGHWWLRNAMARNHAHTAPSLLMPFPLHFCLRVRRERMRL